MASETNAVDNTIKIKELPVKMYNNLEDTDIMLVEDAEDTYSITMEQLRMYFTGDGKINDALQEMNSKFDQFKQEVETRVQELVDSNSSLSSQVTNLSQDLEQAKAQIGQLTERLTGVDTRLDEHDTTLTNHTNQIESLLDTLNNEETGLVKRMEKLEETLDPSFIEQVQKNKEAIEELQEQMKTVQGTFGELDGKTVRKCLEELYDELMKYIDYYHHVKETPPNFNEPFEGETASTAITFPVGTIFELTTPPEEDNSCEAIEKFPGTWTYKGVSTSINEEGEPVIHRYTWERTS